MDGLAHLVLLAACLTTASSTECYRRDQSNFCSCTILSSDSKTNITINLEHIGLKYPYKVDGGEDNKYIFLYTPCKPVTCPNTGEPSAVCEYVKEQMYWVSVGRFTNFLWDVTQNNPANLTFKITYGGGSDGRIAVVDFQTAPTATAFTFSKQNKDTFYFTVKGDGIKPYNWSQGDNRSMN